jgi:hsp70-interacting protein
MSATAGGGSGGNNPWQWLGLLKWSLAYSDGTSPSSLSPMSEEDKAFLEMVMKEGIIDENERMKEILKQVTENLEEMREKPDEKNQEMQDEIEGLLQELRDIVEQIDYSRAFAAMKGLPFLMGCISQQEVPKAIRASCLGVLSTMAQHNPPIQKELLEMGAIRTLSEIFEATPEEDAAFRSKIMQALSATVRSHELAENVFSGVEQSRQIILEGLHGKEVLQKRTLFFLRALVTSDASTRERVRHFAHAIAHVVDTIALSSTAEEECSAELREMALGFLEQILEQRKSVNIILDRKDALVAQGVQRISALRALTGEEREFASVELELWENLLVLLARATPDIEETPLMITGAAPETIPQ